MPGPKRSKVDRFAEDTAKQATKALEAMRELAKAADRARYEWKDEQIDHLVTTLRAEIDKIEVAFTEAPAPVGFSY